jgi:hypothetical protein
MDLTQEILSLKERNKRVEADKQWETSWFRRMVISLMTYAVAAVWLAVIKEPNLWWKAFVPVAGYMLSTLSLPAIKKWRVAKQDNY